MTADAAKRNFYVGWKTDIGGVHYRVVEGYKSPEDLRLEWRCAGQWRPVHMAHAALHTQFFFENEDALYRSPRSAGGNYFLGFLHDAAKRGWETAVQKLEDEKKRRRPA